jgi:hypothetical protein
MDFQWVDGQSFVDAILWIKFHGWKTKLSIENSSMKSRLIARTSLAYGHPRIFCGCHGLQRWIKCLFTISLEKQNKGCVRVVWQMLIEFNHLNSHVVSTFYGWNQIMYCISWMILISSWDFMHFHGWISIPLGWLQIHIIDFFFEIKTFQFAFNRVIHKTTPFHALFNPSTHLSIFKHCFFYQNNEILLHN